MELQITIYQDETGMYVVECPVIPGCVSQGATEAEALKNIREAIAACLEVRREEVANKLSNDTNPQKPNVGRPLCGPPQWGSYMRPKA